MHDVQSIDALRSSKSVDHMTSAAAVGLTGHKITWEGGEHLRDYRTLVMRMDGSNGGPMCLGIVGKSRPIRS